MFGKKSNWSREVVEYRPGPISRCGKCGHIVPMNKDLTGRFCPTCGHKHPSLKERIEEFHQPRCPNCRAASQYGTYCMECGKKIARKSDETH